MALVRQVIPLNGRPHSAYGYRSRIQLIRSGQLLDVVNQRFPSNKPVLNVQLNGGHLMIELTPSSRAHLKFTSAPFRNHNRDLTATRFLGHASKVRDGFVKSDRTDVVNASNRLVTAGFIDPHTHVVFAGDRVVVLAGRERHTWDRSEEVGLSNHGRHESRE